jgi:hypothetical protein
MQRYSYAAIGLKDTPQRRRVGRRPQGSAVEGLELPDPADTDFSIGPATEIVRRLGDTDFGIDVGSEIILGPGDTISVRLATLKTGNRTPRCERSCVWPTQRVSSS